MHSIRAVVLLAFALSLFAAEKPPDPTPRDWKTGTLLSQIIAWGRLRGFIIDSDGCRTGAFVPTQCYAYRVEWPALGGWRRPNVTIQGPIQYFLEKRTFYILDDDKREFKMALTVKLLHPPNYSIKASQ